MNQYQHTLQWLDLQRKPMIELLTKWVNINSGTDNLEGLKKMRLAISESLQVFGEEVKVITLEPGSRINEEGDIQAQHFGKALRIVKRPEAPIQVLLCGHMDTVYPADSPFQKATPIDSQTLVGPGATDMKGGLVIMFKALEAFEQFNQREKVGWEVIINPDEEIGSLGSESLIRNSTKGKHIGLIFEPSFPDGSIVCERKGSTNFTIISKGVAAHAGRDFEKGKNAITHLIRLLVKIEQLNGSREGLTINLGRIQGGGPTNIVPDMAICHCNSRMKTMADVDFLWERIGRIIEEENLKEGVDLKFHRTTFRPPKEFDLAHQNLFQDLLDCSNELSLNLHWKPSGGVCDGNILAQEGLATVDTLGAIGSGIHTFKETIHLDSLTDRAKLCALFLMKTASHAIDINRYQQIKTTAGDQ